MPRTDPDIQEWDGSAFCVQVLGGRRRGIAECGRWSAVPDALLQIAAAAFDEEVMHARFYWRAGTSGPYCDVRLTSCRATGSDVVLLAGEPVYALPYELSKREVEILTLLTTGDGNNEIAATLGLSPRTVATHVDNVLRKLDAVSRTAAAARALDEGLLTVPSEDARECLRHTRIGRLLASGSRTGVPPAPTRGEQRPRLLRRRPLIIGAALPTDGKGATDGKEMLHGLRLAQEEINADGGIHGRMIEIELTDIDIDDAASTRRAIQTLADREVDVLTSGYVAHQDAAHDEAASTGIPYLHAATSGVMERRVGDDPAHFSRILQVCPSDTHYAPGFVKFMSGLRRTRQLPSESRTLVCLQQTSWHLVDFGITRAQVLADADDWELAVIDVSDGDDWTTITEQALAQEPCAILIGSYFPDNHESVVRAVRGARTPSLVYSIYAPSVPDWRERLGGAADGVVWATTTGTYSDAIGRRFADRYARRFGTAPGRSHAGLAYDRAHIIGKAWAGTDDFRDFGQVARRLRRSTHRGVNGAYSFDEITGVAVGYDDDGGDPSLAQAHVVYQVQDGRQEIIAPRPHITSRFRVPDWIDDRHRRFPGPNY
ncbi:ABC transporter substrate-binding protein [Gordonia sp. NPDC003376]